LLPEGQPITVYCGMVNNSPYVAKMIPYIQCLRNYIDIFSYFYLSTALFYENGEKIMPSERTE
jgi:hypothetical protein